jgi:hypothetical protein
MPASGQTFPLYPRYKNERNIMSRAFGRRLGRIQKSLR